MKKTIGIIGFGNMGSAIAERIKAKYQIIVFDKDKNKTNNISGIIIAKDSADLLNKTGAVILAIKPQDFSSLLEKIRDCVLDKLFISIAAGITTNYIENYLMHARVVRVMPNMPARIGKGMSCLCKGKFATHQDLDFTERLFRHLGQTLILDESMMDAATAISGSGPGYFYDFIAEQNIDYQHIPSNIRKQFADSLAKAAKELTFNKEQARLLANATTAGSIDMLKVTKLSPVELKKQITSSGGTTEAALEVLHKGGSLVQAVKAALRRAKELSKEYK